MAIQVCTGAQLSCSMGLAPAAFVATPKGARLPEGDAANVQDCAPFANIAPFGQCRSLANPSVAAATASAAGVLTPMPCVPVTPAPWAPGAAVVLIAGAPALNEGCILQCAWGGVIGVVSPGQVKVQVK